jgi:hypothetical protein
MIFECVGRPLIASLIEVAPVGAQLVLVGTGMQQESFTVLSAAMKRLRMTFTLGYESEDFGFILRMLGAGRISIDPLVTATVSLEDLPETFELLGRPKDHCKVVIIPGPERLPGLGQRPPGKGRRPLSVYLFRPIAGLLHHFLIRTHRFVFPCRSGLNRGGLARCLLLGSGDFQQEHRKCGHQHERPDHIPQKHESQQNPHIGLELDG